MAQIIFYILIGLMIFQAIMLVRDVVTHRDDLGPGNWLISGIIGFIADFADTIGIGSFALTTMMLNVTKQNTDDRKLPGILNVGHAIPVLTEAVIFVTVIKVDALTLVALILAAIVGSWFGSRYVTKLSETAVQKWIGWALLIKRGEIRHRYHRQLLIRCLDDGWCWAICAMYGDGLHARNDTISCFSDHDVFMRGTSTSR